MPAARSGYYAVSPNILNRDFTADKPNQKWVGDITYIPTDEGWLYATIVKDLCLKKIFGYSFSSRIDTNLTVTALKMAVNRQKPQDNLIFHSDRGVQYASAGYREALAEYNITQSMSRKGEPYDNAVAENFSAVLSANLFTTNTTKPELKHRLIYLLTLKLITILCDHNQHSIGFRRLSMNTYLAFMPRKLLDNE